jgi:hypothetical protein
MAPLRDLQSVLAADFDAASLPAWFEWLRVSGVPQAASSESFERLDRHSKAHIGKNRRNIAFAERGR